MDSFVFERNGGFTKTLIVSKFAVELTDPFMLRHGMIQTLYRCGWAKQHWFRAFPLQFIRCWCAIKLQCMQFFAQMFLNFCKLSPSIDCLKYSVKFKFVTYVELSFDIELICIGFKYPCSFRVS